MADAALAPIKRDSTEVGVPDNGLPVSKGKAEGVRRKSLVANAVARDRARVERVREKVLPEWKEKPVEEVLGQIEKIESKDDIDTLRVAQEWANGIVEAVQKTIKRVVDLPPESGAVSFQVVSPGEKKNTAYLVAHARVGNRSRTKSIRSEDTSPITEAEDTKTTAAPAR